WGRGGWGAPPRPLSETYDSTPPPPGPCPPFKIGLDNPNEIAGRPAEPYEWIPFTYPFNMTGQPACSVPAGFTADKPPVGLQIVGRRFDDVTVLRGTRAFERAQPWQNFKPPTD